MRDYTEELKKHWQSNDLAFIATLNKISDHQGFFNHFINPINKKKLYYPVFDDRDIIDRRVSFFYGEATKLVDGDFYKVTLGYTEIPKGKNNPYFLQVISISALNQAKIKKLLEEEKENESITYYGCYKRSNDVFAAFKNVMLSETGEILMSEGESQKVFVSPKITLKENAYYSFSIKENPGKLPNAIPKTIEELKLNPYKDYIRLRFERLNNPEANKMIANLMREIGKGMYSSKQRMIFELLQNADDAPGREKVEFHIDVNGDYFFIMHDGAPFNKDDVEAITSAAESTKKSDNKKTGYKGIGFKSVFTDSSEVWLKSGGYQFAFLRNSQFFEDFDKFYFSSGRYKKYPELLAEDKLKYRTQRLKFNGSTDIPWQVVPIWQDFLPNEFNDSNFNNFNNPVQFALKLGKNNIDEYKLAIDNITKRPQFLLFLRNTSKFKFTSLENGVTVLRNDRDHIIEIIRSKRGEHNLFYYIKQAFEGIEVSDEAFSKLNIELKKQSKINDYNEVSYYFTDFQGREIETIPPKLASAKKTEISFGISIVNNKISPEKEYVEELPKYSSLFTYLPMEDTRFQLPFLVNADFVPSADRQKIQGDNLWNKYVMIKVAEKHVETLTHFANEFIKNNDLYSSYLSLLLKNLLPEDDTATQVIESYNEKYLEQLYNLPIIVNDQNQIQLLSKTILDNSGLIELFGQEVFYEIIDTEKRLPHSRLDSSYLKSYDYLNVEIIDIEELASHITPEICERLGVLIADKTLYEKPELLRWLNELVKYISNDFGKIPFIVHNDALFSLERLLLEKDAWVINRNTETYEPLFIGLGYHTVNLQLEKYTNVNNYLLSIRGYINDKALAYERIASNEKLSKLGILLKLKLTDFFQNSEFMMGIGETKYFGELKLFNDKNGTPRPLRQLLSRKDILEIDSIQQFIIEEKEYEGLTDLLKKELIKKNKIFTSLALNNELFNEWSLQFNSQNIADYVNDLKSIYSWIDDGVEILHSQWANIPWIYINDETRFIGSDKVLWSSAFHQLSFISYQTLKAIFHKSKLKVLPLKECGDLIQLFGLKTDNTLISDWTVITNLDLISANTLLDWMEDDGAYNDFFEEYNLNANNDGLWSITAIENKQIFDGSEIAIKAYISSSEVLNSLFAELNVALCSEKRHVISLLQGDKLLKAIIESKSFDQKLASLLPQNSSWKLFEVFLSNLPEFRLATDNNYDSNTPEHIIISYILKNVEDTDAVPSEVERTINILLAKIIVNQNPISDYDLSDIIQFGKGEEKKILNLSQVLEEFKGESDILDNVIESFVSIKEKLKLRKLIFRTRRMPFDEICSKIEAETASFYSVTQVIFQLLHEKYIGKKQWKKAYFVDHWIKEKNESQLHIDYNSFLDLLLKLDFIDLFGFSFYNLVLKYCVDVNWSIDSEALPQWMINWVEIEKDKRLAFISKLGYHGTTSPIVKLRQAAVSENYDQNTVIRYFDEAKPNTQIIWNTIKWLSSYNSNIISKNIDLIKQINDYITLDKNNLKAVLIPIIESISKDGSRSYKLKEVSINSKLYTINIDDKFAHVIFGILKQENEEFLFVDHNCGKKSVHFNTEVIRLTESIDSELLEKDSKLWEETFYRKWEHFANYSIYIYKGNEIPYKRTFNNITINKFTNDLKAEHNRKYYICDILKGDVLNNLPSTFPKEILTKLKEWHYKTLQNESLLDEDSFEYKEDIDRLLQDRLGISEEEQKSESGNAKTHTVYFLDEEGYDVTNISDAGAYLTNIIDPDGNYVNCIIRSAKGGLLYLDKEHWDMLEDNHTYLVSCQSLIDG